MGVKRTKRRMTHKRINPINHTSRRIRAANSFSQKFLALTEARRGIGQNTGSRTHRPALFHWTISRISSSHQAHQGMSGRPGPRAYPSLLPAGRPPAPEGASPSRSDPLPVARLGAAAEEDVAWPAPGTGVKPPSVSKSPVIWILVVSGSSVSSAPPSCRRYAAWPWLHEMFSFSQRSHTRCARSQTEHTALKSGSWNGSRSVLSVVR